MVMDGHQRGAARRAKALLAAYDQARALIEAGLYVAGSNAEIDAAIVARPRLDAFLRQGLDLATPMSETRTHLSEAINGGA